MARQLSQNTINKFKKKLLAEREQLIAILEQHHQERENIRISEASAERAAELKIEDLYNGTINKIPPYNELKAKYNLSDDEIAYVGDDIIDIPVMNLVGVPIATENASNACKDAAIYITKKPGGDGAFREAVEWILSKQGILENTLEELRVKVQNN